jgi:protein-arginine kinase activator protein McsA
MSIQEEDKETRKMCDVCVKAPVMDSDDATNKVLDDLSMSNILDGEVEEWLADEFANKEVCAACYFEYIGMKQRQLTDAGASQYYFEEESLIPPTEEA